MLLLLHVLPSRTASRSEVRQEVDRPELHRGGRVGQRRDDRRQGEHRRQAEDTQVPPPVGALASSLLVPCWARTLDPVGSRRLGRRGSEVGRRARRMLFTWPCPMSGWLGPDDRDRPAQRGRRRGVRVDGHPVCLAFCTVSPTRRTVIVQSTASVYRPRWFCTRVLPRKVCDVAPTLAPTGLFAQNSRR